MIWLQRRNPGQSLLQSNYGLCMFVHALNKVFLKSYGAKTSRSYSVQIHIPETGHCPPLRNAAFDEDHDGMILAEQQGSQENIFPSAHDIQSNSSRDNGHTGGPARGAISCEILEQPARCYAKQRMDASALQSTGDKEPVMSKIGGHLTCPRTPVY